MYRVCSVLMFCCFFSLSNGRQKITNKPQDAHIRVEFEGLSQKDTIYLIFYENVLDYDYGRYFPHTQEFVVLDGKGIGQFYIKNITRPGYIFLASTKNKYHLPLECLDNYLIEPGDNVTIRCAVDSEYIKNINVDLFHRENTGYFSYLYTYPAWSFYFSGKGSEKFQCRYQADRITSGESTAFVIDTSGNLVKENTSGRGRLRYSTLGDLSINILDQYKRKISKIAYEILKADFFGFFNYRTTYIFNMGTLNPVLKNQKRENAYRVYHDSIYSQILDNISDEAKAISSWYSYSILRKELIGNQRLNDSVYLNIARKFTVNYKGELRDKLLTMLVLGSFKKLQEGENLLNDMMSVVKTRYCLKELSDLKETTFKGKPAYNFSLIDTAGNIVRLSDFKGKSVFIDFWYTGCTACADYYHSVLKEVKAQFQKSANIVFLSVSIDTDRDTWLKSIYSGKYSSPDSYNLNTNWKGIYDPVINYYRVIGYPRPILIDPLGNLFSSSDKTLRYSGTSGLVSEINAASLIDK